MTFAVEVTAPPSLQPDSVAAQLQGEPPAVSSSATTQAPPESIERAPACRPPETPTQEGPRGLRFDFNDGCRVTLPETDQP